MAKRRYSAAQKGAIHFAYKRKAEALLAQKLEAGVLKQRWVGARISKRDQREPCPVCEAEIEMGEEMLEIAGEPDWAHAACAMGVKQERAAKLAAIAKGGEICGRCRGTVFKGEELTPERWHVWCEEMAA